MSLTIGKLLKDAKKLSTRLRDHDAAADGVISSAQDTLKNIIAMKQFQEDVQKLNSIARNRPHSQLIMDIQQENRSIKHLQNENKELRASLEDHQNAIELIMSKYREHITALINSTKCNESSCNNATNLSNVMMDKILQQKTQQLIEVLSVIRQSLKMDDEQEYCETELISKILIENKGLREMLEISRISGSQTQPLFRNSKVSKEVQTEAEELFKAEPIETNSIQVHVTNETNISVALIENKDTENIDDNVCDSSDEDDKEDSIKFDTIKRYGFKSSSGLNGERSPKLAFEFKPNKTQFDNKFSVDDAQSEIFSSKSDVNNSTVLETFEEQGISYESNFSAL